MSQSLSADGVIMEMAMEFLSHDNRWLFAIVNNKCAISVTILNMTSTGEECVMQLKALREKTVEVDL